MQQTLAESSVLVAEEPPPIEGDEPPLRQLPDRSAKRCTVDCTHCSIATLFNVLERAKSLEERVVPHNEAGKLKRSANRIVNDGRKEFLNTVTSSTDVLASTRARLAIVAEVRNRFAGCHHSNAECFHEEVTHLLEVSAPSKILGNAFENQA